MCSYTTCSWHPPKTTNHFNPSWREIMQTNASNHRHCHWTLCVLLHIQKNNIHSWETRDFTAKPHGFVSVIRVLDTSFLRSYPSLRQRSQKIRKSERWKGADKFHQADLRVYKVTLSIDGCSTYLTILYWISICRVVASSHCSLLGESFTIFFFFFLSFLFLSISPSLLSLWSNLPK